MRTGDVCWRHDLHHFTAAPPNASAFVGEEIVTRYSNPVRCVFSMHTFRGIRFRQFDWIKLCSQVESNALTNVQNDTNGSLTV